MSKQLVETGLATLEFSRRQLLSLLEDVPDDKLTHPPSPGANHALWIVGHLASADNFFMTTLGKQPACVKEEWAGLFGMGSTPVADASKYPSLAQLKDVAHSSRTRLCEWFGSLDETQLFTELPEDFKTFAPHFGGLMFSIAWHEGLHTGQLSAVRRSLGIPPKY